MIEDDATSVISAGLSAIQERPAPFSRSTVKDLWTAPHTSETMLRAHLDGSHDAASRRTSFIDASAAWISATFRLAPGRSVLDLGCGPGLYTTRLARTGARVVGVDFSERSVAHARAAAAADGLEITYIVADYLELRLDRRFDLVTLIYCDYCALGPAERALLLDRVADLLAPGGSFLFDVHSVAAFDAVREETASGRGLMNGFWSPRPYVGFHALLRYEAEHVTLDRYEIVDEDGATSYFNWLQYFDREALAGELATTGFEIEALYADVAGRPLEPGSPEIAVVVRRAGADSQRGHGRPARCTPGSLGSDRRPVGSA